ncbi:GPW/gp25 family protein [Methylocaldum sp. MU1018]
MKNDEHDTVHTSFLGSGWSFPPEFVAETGEVAMVSDEQDVAESLKILFGTVLGERFFKPKYGLDMQGMLFEPIGTTMKTFLTDRVKTQILIYEPRINVLSLELDTSMQSEGRIGLVLEYAVKATNSRFNLVYPFYRGDGNELRSTVDF